MTMRFQLGLGVMLVAAGLAAHAQEKACTPAESTKAEQMIDRVVGWEQLYKAYQDYRHCDKGSVDEIFTEALLRCIVEWKHIEGLARPMEKDTGYRDFVHRHLNSPAAKADLNSIYSRAKMSCPKGLETFCTDITMTVKPFAGMETLQSAPDPAAAAPPKK